MQLNISAVGMVRQASISLDHLTVIAGQNDTGKSTIGKVIFAIAHGLNDPLVKATQMGAAGDGEKADIARSIRHVFDLEFLDQALHKNGFKESVIELKSGRATAFRIKFAKEDELEIDEAALREVTDATIIEGPSIFQYAPLIMAVFDEHGMPYNKNDSLRIPYHAVDLARKLQSPSTASTAQKEQLVSEVQKFIDALKPQSRYLYEKQGFTCKEEKKGKSLKAGNVASGVKALSVLAALAHAGYIHKKTILIFDGPETSLHPEWQIAYAHIICKLADLGVKVVLTTHSPYMLEAIKEFTKNNPETKFYVSYQDSEGYIAYQDTMGDITPLINALSRPLYDLINTDDDDDEF